MADVNSVLYKKGIVDREQAYSLAPQKLKNKALCASMAENDAVIAGGDKFMVDRMYKGASIVRVTELLGSTDSGVLKKRHLVSGAESNVELGLPLDADYDIFIECGGAASAAAGALRVMVEALLIL